jgi:hypothetical protein
VNGLHNVVGIVGYTIVAFLATLWGLTWWQTLIIVVLTIIVGYAKLKLYLTEKKLYLAEEK